ncbi:serine/threonine-protein kinase 11-interacting protein isoform X2 [Diachasma alloeum]|uniref:serine/threonine-protein kinase 11-interacting protein isoform X2 n=1 Tax=Diachasma alloeum TaxID=454923 RepID=UPI0007382E8F|nr:serine/threonine-protein kinase 11-interacting protein isoform X2 [Diachasma alloeum]
MSVPKIGMPSMQEILELAGLLRKNGDQVLNGTSKLSLSTKLLHNLNDAFSLIVDDSKDLESSFQVCNSSEIEVFRDLKFLHDFVQKTISLKVSQTPIDPKTSIDITKFRHLKYLELQKVCIDLVTGIQGVRGQLESISCTGGGGVGSIGRLLTACGGDAGVGFVWASLKRLSLPYNGLGRLDKSLELAPWLQTLDLSHNFISTAGEIDCLPSLKHVNFGYNKLENVPRFNRGTYRTLQTLVLKNNYVETLSGLQGLDCLAELDLSFNCLADHSVLWPLETMTALLWVTLEGNPLSYHLRHRTLTIKHLNSSLAESKFVLDHSPLSKSEKLLLSENRLFTMRSVPSPCKEDLSNSFCCSVNSDSNTSEIITSQMTDSLNSMERSFVKRRRQNVMEAVIADDEKVEESLSESARERSYLETSMEHLETKKKILALREKFGGERWLSSDAGSFVQDIMGIERNILASTPSIDSPVSAAIGDSAAGDHRIIEDIGENPGEGTEENEESSEEVGGRVEGGRIESYDPEEEKGQLFLVQKKRENEELEELFLVITAEDVKERDSITGRIKYRWSTETVLSCVMGRGETPTIDFIFDTTRRDRQTRTYLVEADDAGKIVKTVCEFIKARPILLKVFKCMKCSTHFSQDPDCFLGVSTVPVASMKPPTCPSCKSTLVIQTDELLTSDGENVKDLDEIKPDNQKSNRDRSEVTRDTDESQSANLKHSASHSSIGGTEGAMSTSMVYSDSQAQAQVSCSATSLEESRESTPSASTVAKKYESDIEVLSNPSQSSIEVLDDGTRSTSTPSRKRSSEERRIAVAPTLLTIPDTTPVMAGLTESSSSGSLTDSICTAYENRNLQVSIVSGQSHNNRSVSESDNTLVGSDIENINTPVSNLTSMLGGLLQSMKIGTNRGSPLKSDDGPDFSSTSDIQYSYTDFKSLDHRIKLHLILNVFEQENEELVLLLRSDILIRTQVRPFPGCLVLTTSKIYILRITGPEGEDPQRWLQKEMSWTMDRLRTFSPLPFKQGLVVELQQPNKIGEEPSSLTLLCILQDFQRTSNLLLYLTELSLPPSCELEFLVPEQCTGAIHSLMASSKFKRAGDAVRILALFSSAALQLENQEVKPIKIGGLVVTTSSLILTDDHVHWLLPDSVETPVKLTEQGISNLIEVIFNEETLALSFLDEVAGVEELWTLKFVSPGAAEAVINAIQPPWEELFSVPLQITTNSTEHDVDEKP